MLRQTSAVPFLLICTLNKKFFHRSSRGLCLEDPTHSSSNRGIVYRTWRDNSFIPDTLFPHKLLRCLATEDRIGWRHVPRGFVLYLNSFCIPPAVFAHCLRFKLKKDFVSFALSSRPQLYVTLSSEWNILIVIAWSIYATLHKLFSAGFIAIRGTRRMIFMLSAYFDLHNYILHAVMILIMMKSLTLLQVLCV